MLEVPTIEQITELAKWKPEEFRKFAEAHPEILEAVLKHANRNVKYVKLTEEQGARLKKEADKRDLPEGVLLGLGALLILSILSGNS